MQIPRLVIRLIVLFVTLTVWFAQATAEEAVIVAADSEVGVASFAMNFVIDGETEPRLLRLRYPDRVAVDFPHTLVAASIKVPEAGSLVSGFEHGLTPDDRYRFVFTLAEPVIPVLEREGDRIALRIQAGNPATSSDGVSSERAVKEGRRARRGAKANTLTIAVDPGHGGEDEGAVSENGTLEKDLNLALGLQLKDALLVYEDVAVIMTRSDDRFVGLDERAHIARQAEADLFVSLHADSIRDRSLRGATVYTLSRKASDGLSAEIAAGENAADRFGPDAAAAPPPLILDILGDLTRRETVNFSEYFANSLVAALQAEDFRMIKHPKRSAGFRVLMAPDVPSILLEAGFLSNQKDEKLLKDPEWRGRMARILAAEIVKFWRGERQQAESLEARGPS